MSVTSMKNVIRKEAVTYYNSNGLKKTLDLIDSRYSECYKRKDEQEILNNICGEFAEVVCELYLKEFCKMSKGTCFYSKGLCLKDKFNSEYTTELDLTLFTPNKIILIESKFRKGAVSLKDTCLVSTDYGEYNVHDQNIHHLKILGQYTEKHRLCSKEEKPYKLTLFLETPNKVTETRSKDCIELVPYLNRSSVLDTLNSLAFKAKMWDVPKLYKDIKILEKESEANFKQHLDRLQKGD